MSKANVKKNKKSKINNNDDDEATKLLAAVGGTVKDMADYEEDVILKAQRDTAPKLTGTGFPDLQPLAPSYSNRRTQQNATAADLPHFTTVLSKIRSELSSLNHDESHRSQVLRLKEQMVLVYLRDCARLPKEDLPIHVPREVAAERSRIYFIQNNQHHSSHASKPSSSSSKRQSLKRTKRQRDDDDGEDNNMTNEQRLQHILKHGDALPKRKRVRKTLQEWKQQQLSSSRNTKDEDNDEQERRQYLKKKRRERQAQRRKRLAQLLGVVESEEEEEEMEFEDAKQPAVVANDVENDVATTQNNEAFGDNSKASPQDVVDLTETSDVDDGAATVKVEDTVDLTETANVNEGAATVKVEDNGDHAEHAATVKVEDKDEHAEQAATVKFEHKDEHAEQAATVKVENKDEHAEQAATVKVEDKDEHAEQATTVKVEDKDDHAEQAALVRVEDKDDHVEQAATMRVEDKDDLTEHIECPLCHDQIPYIASSNRDVVLSQHMDECQRSTGRRRSRRSGRSTASYAEHNDDKDEEYNDEVYKEPSNTKEEDEDTNLDESFAKPRTTRSSVRRASTAAPKKKAVPLKPTVSSALDDLEEWVYEDRVDDWIESGLKNMKVMAERDQSEVPPGAVVYDGGNLRIPAWINNRLFSYQRTGVRWMWELHRQEAGGIVGDEMGLGKTVQVCSYLGSMAASRKLKSVLVISPATVLQHWLKELSIWAPGLRRILVHKSGETDGISRNVSAQLLHAMNKWLKRARADRLYEPIDEADFEEQNEDSFVGTGYVFVTTYENVRRSPDIWTGHRWSYVVLDEGQKIRNPDADVTLACKRLRTVHRLLLSGTPIQNDLKELWTLFDFVFPGRLGTLPAFETEFAEPIKRGGFSNASPMQVQMAYRCALVLKDLINPYMLRRQKKDIKEVSRMPGKTEQVLFCRLGKRQRELYESYLRSDEVVNILRGSPQLFRSITILRKICNHPDLVCDPTEAAYESFIRSGYNQIPENMDSDDEDDELDNFDSLVERSGKLEVLAKILPLWKKQGHRVLIFCQWTKMLNILQHFMMVQGWKFGRMDGKTSVSSRQRLVDTFNEDDSYFALLMTTRTGGVGLNLTGADRVVIYDPDWNPQTDSQARARSHRFGQSRPVTIYRLITAGTIEEKIYHRQIFKTALTNRVLQDPKQKRLFSQRDLRDFFTLKADDGSIIKGGSAVTELGTVTGGEGVIHPEDVAASNADNNDGGEDDKKTLETVMKSKGLAGVFDHDFVDKSDTSRRKTASVREMEARARKVAQDAVRALQASAASQVAFEPTWTGSKESAGRFGHGNLHAKRSSSILNRSRQRDDDEQSNSFGRAGVVRGSEPARSSKSLLAGLLKGAASASSNGSNHVNDDPDAKKFADLLKRIKTYIRRCGGGNRNGGGGPSTDEILKEFASVPTSDAAIFRRLLSSVAKVQRGKWRLKDD